MPYDASLDVATFKEMIDFENTRITIGAQSLDHLSGKN